MFVSLLLRLVMPCCCFMGGCYLTFWRCIVADCYFFGAHFVASSAHGGVIIVMNSGEKLSYQYFSLCLESSLAAIV